MNFLVSVSSSMFLGVLLILAVISANFSRNLVSFILSFLLNKLDLLLNNLLELTSVEVSDVLAVDLEHAYDN